MIYQASFCIHLLEFNVKLCEINDVHLSCDENTHSVAFSLATHTWQMSSSKLPAQFSELSRFGISLLLLHSVGFEEAFNSEYCLKNIYSLSVITCSWGYYF